MKLTMFRICTIETCFALVSLVANWLAQGHPSYTADEATVVYISDVGGDNHALFIVLGTLTALLLVSILPAAFNKGDKCCFCYFALATGTFANMYCQIIYVNKLFPSSGLPTRTMHQ